MPSAPEQVKNALRLARGGLGRQQDFRATVTNEEWKGRRHQHARMTMSFKAPSAITLVVEESNWLLKGMALETDGGPRVRVKLPGLLGVLPITVATTDPRARSLNGLTPNQITPFRFIEALEAPGATVTVVSESTIEGVTVLVLRVEDVALPGPMTAAEVGVELETGIPVLTRLYEGEKLRFESRLSEWRSQG
jgi:hypothetical protein